MALSNLYRIYLLVIQSPNTIEIDAGQNRLSKSFADDSVRSDSLAPVAVESTSAIGVGGTMVVLELPRFFFLPNETPRLLAKLAKVPLAVISVDADGPANGDVRGRW